MRAALRDGRPPAEGFPQGERRIALGDRMGEFTIALHLAPEASAGRTDADGLLDRPLAAKGRELRPDLVEGDGRHG